MIRIVDAFGRGPWEVESRRFLSVVLYPGFFSGLSTRERYQWTRARIARNPFLSSDFGLVNVLGLSIMSLRSSLPCFARGSDVAPMNGKGGLAFARSRSLNFAGKGDYEVRSSFYESTLEEGHAAPMPESRRTTCCVPTGSLDMSLIGNSLSILGVRRTES